MIQFNPTKYVDLIIACIKYGADTDGKIVKTKLAKLIYLADFAYYAETLTPISGAKYKRLPQGPVPTEYFDVLTFLESTNVIHTKHKGSSILINLVNKQELPGLSDDEINIVKKICKKWKDKKSSEIVDFTHRQLPWKISREMQEVPYSLILQEENVY
jgi:uncharacterized phage-associated protein